MLSVSSMPVASCAASSSQIVRFSVCSGQAGYPGAGRMPVYFSHPESRYFVLGRVDRDQVEDYARRKGWTVDEAEKWLSPNLGYRTENE